MSKKEESNTNNNNNNNNNPDNKDKKSFTDLVNAYGVDKSIARGLRAKMKVPVDGTVVDEATFVKHLKAYATQVARG